MVYVSHLCNPYFLQNIILYYSIYTPFLFLHLAEYLSRVIALPSVKYSGRVETDEEAGARPTCVVFGSICFKVSGSLHISSSGGGWLGSY